MTDQSLKGRLTRILSAKMDECNWDTQKKLLHEWTLRDKHDGLELANPLLNQSDLTRYLSAPQIAKYGTLKDLAAKYIVNRFHDGKFWLENTVELMAELIHRVTGLPIQGEKVPLDMPSAAMIRQYLGSEEEGTNSKGIQISQTSHAAVEWALTIIVVCLTNAGRPSSVKREVLLVAVDIALNGTVYNWSSYLADLLAENIKNYHDTGASIRFPSLIIWLAMTDVVLIGEAQFTATNQPLMLNFRTFSMHNKHALRHPQQLFEFWFQNLKLKCGKWRVP